MLTFKITCQDAPGRTWCALRAIVVDPIIVPQEGLDMIKRPVISATKAIAANALLILAAFAMPVLAQDSASVKMRVELEPGIGGATGVTYRLYRVEGCCEECLRTGHTSCRKCGCPIARATESVTLHSSGLVKFEKLPAGTYLIENEVSGKSFGYEAKVNVGKNETKDLGAFFVDSGKPFSFTYDLNHAFEAAGNFKSTDKMLLEDRIRLRSIN
jgi:hypothetical protein